MPMRTGTGVCGTDELKVLQHIADSVVDELSRTAACQATDKTKLYHRVGKQVFKACVIGDELLNVDEIKRAVLAKF